MAKKSAFCYVLGVLVVLILAFVGVLTSNLVVESRGKVQEKPRLDLPGDVPWDKIPWKNFAETFPYDEVPWDKLPENTPWEDIPWEEIPWAKIPDDIVDKLPLADIPWKSLPEDLPWSDLQGNIDWDKMPWEKVPWSELPEDFPYDEVPWNDLPEDFNWKAVTCEHEFEFDKTILPATCVQEGLDMYTCSICEFSEPRVTEPTGVHVYGDDWLIDVLPTCVEHGLQYRLCVLCQTERETQPIDPTGVHQFNEETGKCETCDRQQITILSCSLEKEYDGHPLSASEETLQESGKEPFTILFGSLKDEHTVHITFTGAITKVGTTVNSFEVEIWDKNGDNASDGYEITLLAGTLTVIPKAIILQTGSETETFVDGLILSCREFDLNIELAASDRIEIIGDTKLDEPGSCDNVLEIKIINDNDEDVTYCYFIEFVFGKLTLKGA